MKLASLVFACLCMGNRARSTEGGEKLDLQLVQVLFRHGERTPLASEYNTYRYTNLSAYEPYGLGQLTDNGKRQAYNLGRRLRERYTSLLRPDEQGSRETCCAYTSENNRTKTTLQLALAGLYQPTAADVAWSSDSKYDAAATLRTIPQAWDVLLKPNFNPKYINIVNESKTTPRSRALIERHSETLAFVEEKTGVRINRETGLEFAQVACMLHSNERMNISLPAWYNDDTKRDFIKVMQSAFDVLSVTREMKRINGGTIIRQFLRNIDTEAAAIRIKPKKLYLYSGHDINIAAVQRSLAVKEPMQPDFASSVIFEKYRDSGGRVYVRVLFWDSVKNKETVLKFDKCSEFCPIGDFVKIVHDVLPSVEELKDFTGESDIGKINSLYGACE